MSAQRLPKSAPNGFEFQIQDVYQPWPSSWISTFDLVHQRLVLANAGPRGPVAVKSLCELVKPGGWIQLVEAECAAAEDDGPAHMQFMELLRAAFEVFGQPRDRQVVWELAGWVGQAGFVEVGEERVPFMVGRKNENEALRQQGVEALLDALEGMVGVAKCEFFH